MAFVGERFGGVLDAANEVLGRLLCRHPRIHESDEVAQRVIAEYHPHLRLAVAVLVWRVQLLRLLRSQPALARPLEMRADGSAEDTFVGGHPLHTEFGGNTEHLFGD